ncbi:polyadenylate binding protein [Elysia marginata]|uniref:Polyadenylate binding protein n=1 Tax=Elysia marginata TaxID=1093978 RepID=A0AAV4JMK7_9GAST|nr:polyadenylate binding protein [Elysia marginata]
MACRRESISETESKSCNLFVKNFGDALSDKKLFRLFSPFGEVTSAVVRRSAQGQSLGHGFVRFNQPEDASAAIRSLNGSLVNDRELFVGYHQTRDERSIILASHHMLEGANLLVQNLERSIDDEQLMNCFSSFGTITSAKVMMKNKNSLGYGFVCYSTVDAAQKALKGMNNQVLHGKRVAVTVHEKKVSQKPTNLCVSNLDGSINNEILQREFSRYGKIISAKVMTNGRGVSKNYGYVCYKSLEEAESAIEHMDNRLLGRQIITVSFDKSKDDSACRTRQRSKSTSESSDENLEKNKVVVKNLAPWMTEESLLGIFSRFGTIINAEILKANGKSQCCGFVTFASRKEAEIAIWELHNVPVGEKFLDISLLGDPEERGFEDKGAEKEKVDACSSSDEESVSDIDDHQKKTNLYVKNLHPNVGVKDLVEVFSPFGTIDNIKVARTEDGKSKQFGFVNFTTSKAASLAVKKLHNFVLRGNALFVTYHQTKSERTSFLKQRLFERLTGLAQEDQEDDVSPQRQRAKSQDRRSASNRQDRRQGSAARIRSKSQASRSQLNKQPESAYHDQEYKDKGRQEIHQQIPRDLGKEKIFQRKPNESFKAPVISGKGERRGGHNFFSEMAHQDHSLRKPTPRELLQTTPTESELSVGKLINQFNQFSQHTPSSRPLFDRPEAIAAKKRSTGINFHELKSTDFPRYAHEPESSHVSNFQAKQRQWREASTRQESDEDVLRKVNALLHMSDAQVLQHLKKI